MPGPACGCRTLSGCADPQEPTGVLHRPQGTRSTWEGQPRARRPIPSCWAGTSLGEARRHLLMFLVLGGLSQALAVGISGVWGGECMWQRWGGLSLWHREHWV